jgi:hypothetical protein
MAERCLCQCHIGSRGDRWRADGVDLRDVLEAAVSCDTCRPAHSLALLSTRLANAPAPRIKGVYVDFDPKKATEEKPEKEDDGN